MTPPCRLSREKPMRDRISVAIGPIGWGVAAHALNYLHTKGLVALLGLVLVLPLASIPAEATGGSEGAIRRDAPVPPVRAVAEWEPAFGALIRWPLGIPSSLVVELASDDSLYVLVRNQSQENQARNTFSSWNVNLDHCRFIHAPTNSHWTRDWGPHSVFDGNGEWGITDPWFNGYPWVPPLSVPGDQIGQGCEGPSPGDRHGRANVADKMGRDPDEGDGEGGFRYADDDAVNAALAAELGCGLFMMPAFCTGGNFMADGHGTAFSTEQMYRENAPYMDEAGFRALASEYLGIDNYVFLGGTENNGIQHIDCWAKLLDEETIMVKRPPVWHEEYARIEANIQILEGLTNCYGRPYRIVRIDTPPYDGYNVAAYTNSLILNRKVLVPLFGIAGDQAALQTFQDAMPGYEVLGFYGAWYHYDALHCRTMGIFDRHMLRIVHRRLDEETPVAAGFEVAALLDDRSGAGPDFGSLWVHWRLEGGTTWTPVELSPMAAPDSFMAVIPAQPIDSVVEYYIEAASLSGRHEFMPRPAPDGFYSFRVVGDPSSAGSRTWSPSQARLAIHPNPSPGDFSIRLYMPENPGELEALRQAGKWSECRIIDASGRIVRTLRSPGSDGAPVWVWDGLDDSGTGSPSGIYWVSWAGGGQSLSHRLVRIR